MPAVSIIIPTYNHRDFVLATLDSVFAQTFTDYEVIVINDGSPDDTAEVLRPLAEAGRIRYIEQENTGQSVARNRGIALAGGEFIALLDDDDLWPPDKLAWQVEAMRQRPGAGIIAGPALAVNVSGQPLFRGEFIPEVTFERCLMECPFISPGQALIRTPVLTQVGGLNPQIWGTDDWDLWLKIAKNSPVLMEDRVALLYRKHAGNASKNLSRMLDNCFLVLDSHLADVPAENRAAVRQRAYRRLYAIHGKPIILQIKQAIKAGDVRVMLSSLAHITRFSKVMGRDLPARLQLIRDFLPARWAANSNPAASY